MTKLSEISTLKKKTMKYYGGSKCITIMADYVMVDVNLRAIIKI